MKTDKLTWNEALAAYDRDLEILESTRNEYGKFIEQTLEDAAALVAKRFKEPTEHSISKDDEGAGPHPFIAEWKLSGLRSITGLVVQIAPSSAYDGAPGTFLVYLWFDPAAPLGVEFGFEEMEAAFREASLRLEGEPYDPRKHPEEVGVQSLRIAAVDMGDADLPERLASHAVTYLKAAAEMADTAAKPTCDNAHHWARIRLLEVRATFPLEQASVNGRSEWAPKKGLDDWEEGRYLQITKRGANKGKNDDLWVGARTEEDTVFAGYGSFVKEPKQWKALCALGNGETRAFGDAPGATLFDKAALKALAKKGRTAEFRDKVSALFRTFLSTSG